MPSLRVDWCAASAAREACRRWHYSRTLPISKSQYLGVWEAGRFEGAVVFSLGASPSLGSRYGLGPFQAAELTRVALRSHRVPVSRILAIALSQIRRMNPGLRLIVSFADPFHGHHGGIYQAGNWIYTGASSPRWVVRVGGRIFDIRRFNGHGFNIKRPLPPGAQKIRTPGKYRYLMPLDRKMRRAIQKLAQPYPKRTKQSIAASGAQSEEGGVIPTRALQHFEELAACG